MADLTAAAAAELRQFLAQSKVATRRRFEGLFSASQDSSESFESWETLKDLSGHCGKAKKRAREKENRNVFRSDCFATGS